MKITAVPKSSHLLEPLLKKLPNDEVFTTAEVGEKLGLALHQYPRIRAWLKSFPGHSVSFSPRQELYIGTKAAIAALKKAHGIS